MFRLRGPTLAAILMTPDSAASPVLPPMHATGFYLESSARQPHLPRQIELDPLPKTVGRGHECDIALKVGDLSRQHARFFAQDGGLWLADLGSTNGSYVNQQRLSEPVQLRAGDVIHLADNEFRLLRHHRSAGTDDLHTDSGRTLDRTRAAVHGLDTSFPLETATFLELLDREMVAGFKQAVVRPDGRLFAYELLGRSTHPGLPVGPGQLFALAASVGKEVELSRLLRRRSFAQAAAADLRVPLFFNNHPAECLDVDALLAELSALRALYPSLQLVFEVHEAAITDLDMIATIKQTLRRLHIRFAYDDFGAGQARLLELAEVPPDILKFDMALIQGLSSPESSKYLLLEALSKLVHQLGIATLAEGVESPIEAQLCARLQIQLLQGFLFHRPADITAT